jgi:hypothetical protein
MTRTDNVGAFPAPTQITESQHKALLDINAKIQANQAVVRQFQETMQTRMQELQARTAAIWKDIEATSGASMEGINWEPHPQLPMIIPTEMSLRGRALPSSGDKLG